MHIHGCLIFRYFFKEIHMIFDIRKYFDSCFYHSSDLVEVQISCDHFFQIRQCHLIKFFIVHLLHVFAVHPAKFYHVKDCRRFADSVVIEFFYQFFQRENLVVGRRTPSQKCHEVYDGFSQEALIQQILIRRMTAAFGQFLMIFVCDQRAVDVFRNLPSECFIQTVVLRCRGQIFVSSYYMCNSHQMIIDNICKVVSRISIGFDQDHIIQFIIFYCNISVQLIMESCGSFGWHVDTDNIWFSCCQICLDFFFGQVQAVFVIHGDLFSCYFCLQAFQTFFITETIVSVSLLNQFFCIFHVQTLCLSLTLYIRAYTPIFVRTFIMYQTRLCQSTVDNIKCAFHKTFLVSIFDTQHELSTFMFCDQICI